MEERTMDLEGMPARVGEIAQMVRKSEAYPAILGAVAGGIAGALIATIIAGRASSRSSYSASQVDTDEKTRTWSLREIVQFATIAAAVVRQISAWIEERRGEQEEYA